MFPDDRMNCATAPIGDDGRQQACPGPQPGCGGKRCPMTPALIEVTGPAQAGGQRPTIPLVPFS